MKGRDLPELNRKISADSLRVLAVDDCEETREYYIYAMEALKLRCSVAPDGPEALQLLRENADDPFNLFFIDWNMPKMNGLELAKEIKKTTGDESTIIIVSAHDCSTIEREALASGVSLFVTKPLFPSTLVNAINICMGVALYESDVEHRDGFEFNNLFNTHTILVAEDIEINREIMSAVLDRTAICIDYAENGKVAVSMFCENPGRYALILMDINMPEMDGLEATRQIRALNTAEANEIPIIAMTANVFKEDVDQCIKAGMNDHTGKPINADELYTKLRRYLIHYIR
jgi:CheY-like chemotaxis protein